MVIIVTFYRTFSEYNFLSYLAPLRSLLVKLVGAREYKTKVN